MLDIKFICENPEIVKENIKKKFEDKKLPLVDEVISLYGEKCAANNRANDLRANRNKVSKQIGMLMAQGKRDEAEEMKRLVNEQAEELKALEEKEAELQKRVTEIQMKIPNIVDSSVPVGKDDSENVEVQQFGEQSHPDFEIPYHTDIMQLFDGIDKDAAGKVAGEGFYYLMGDIARLHSAVLAYARDFMIDKGFTYCIPPYMIRSKVVTGVMSFEEMDAMLAIFQDVTDEEAEMERQLQMRMDTVDIAQQVIDKQMTVAQEIAGLLGETTAETKVILTQLRDSMMKEADQTDSRRRKIEWK